MKRALDEYYVEGIRTNLSLFKMILRFPDFLEGRLDTGLIDRLLDHEAQFGIAVSESSREALDMDRRRAAALAAVFHELSRSRRGPGDSADSHRPLSRWKLEGRSRLLRQSLPHPKP